MTKQRDRLAGLIWRGIEPFAGPADRMPDHQGWSSDNPMLLRAIGEVRPAVVVEVGVWKGGSALTMAAELRRLGIDGVVIAVDTWLGSSEHWFHDEHFADLGLVDGYPTLYRTFLANVRDRGLEDHILPLPLDSVNAAGVLRDRGIVPDALHIDAGHDFESVAADLRAWWPMLRPGGVLVGDDYYPEGVDVWPEVRRAFHGFFDTRSLENVGGKCYVRKMGGETETRQGTAAPAAWR